MILNGFGQIAYDEWIKLPDRFPNAALDVFQIMPNHMHGIIVLKNISDVAWLAPALPPDTDTNIGIIDVDASNRARQALPL